MSDQVRDSALQNIAQQLGRLSAQGGLATTYATGTWLPALNFTSVSTISYATQAGTWTQTGRNFFCEFAVALATLVSATGAVTIAGLPATVSSAVAAQGDGGLLVNFSGFVSLGGAPIIRASPSTATVSLVTAGATGVTAISASNLSNSTLLSGNFRFYI